MNDRTLVFLVLVGAGVGAAWYVSRRRDGALAEAPATSPMAAAENIAPQALTAELGFGGGAAAELMPAWEHESGGIGAMSFAEFEAEPERAPSAGQIQASTRAGTPRVAKPAHLRPQPARDAEGFAKPQESRLQRCYKCCGGSSKCRKACEWLNENPGDTWHPSAGPAKQCWEKADAR